MKYSAIIAIKLQSIILRLAISFLASIIAALPFAAQEVTGGRIAIIDPDPAIPEFSQKIIAEIRPSFRVIDTDTALTAFNAAHPDNPYNLTGADARRIADAIGCNFLVLLRTGLQPRQGIGRPAYVESFAAAFFVDGRSGRLRQFLLLSNEAGESKQASSLLSGRAKEIAAAAKQIFASPDISPLPEFPELPAADLPENKNFRPPVPYKRIKPDYPLTAHLYSIQATVEIEADIDAEGRVGATSIVRWAGFGLDEAVEDVVRKMNWRPAYRDGRPLATRILLRYNFRKPAKDEEP